MGQVIPLPQPEDKRINVAVYGSLKQGFGNHHLLEKYEATYLGEDTQPYWMMVSLSYFPAVAPTTNMTDVITVEVYEVSKECLAALDRLEGVDNKHYERLRIATKYGNAYMYMYHPNSMTSILGATSGVRVVPSGVWSSSSPTQLWTPAAVAGVLDPVYRTRLKYIPGESTALVPRNPVTLVQVKKEPPEPPKETVFKLTLDIVQEVCDADLPDAAV